MARVTNYARKFFGKCMQKLKVQEGARRAIEIERKAGEEEEREGEEVPR